MTISTVSPAGRAHPADHDGATLTVAALSADWQPTGADSSLAAIAAAEVTAPSYGRGTVTGRWDAANERLGTVEGSVTLDLLGAEVSSLAFAAGDNLVGIVGWPDPIAGVDAMTIPIDWIVGVDDPSTLDTRLTVLRSDVDGLLAGGGGTTGDAPDRTTAPPVVALPVSVPAPVNAWSWLTPDQIARMAATGDPDAALTPGQVLGVDDDGAWAMVDAAGGGDGAPALTIDIATGTDVTTRRLGPLVLSAARPAPVALDGATVVGIVAAGHRPAADHRGAVAWLDDAGHAGLAIAAVSASTGTVTITDATGTLAGDEVTVDLSSLTWT
jgi:hypothetical protein